MLKQSVLKRVNQRRLADIAVADHNDLEAERLHQRWQLKLLLLLIITSSKSFLLFLEIAG